VNPFDELELDPRLSPEELTDVLRRRAERASGPRRARIQELWRQLTVRESDRIRWAFLAHPRPAHADPNSIEALRDQIPPVIARDEPPPLTATLADAIVFPASPDAAPDAPFIPHSLYEE